MPYRASHIVLISIVSPVNQETCFFIDFSLMKNISQSISNKSFFSLERQSHNLNHKQGLQKLSNFKAHAVKEAYR
jgi:hypothetical protein